MTAPWPPRRLRPTRSLRPGGPTGSNGSGNGSASGSSASGSGSQAGGSLISVNGGGSVNLPVSALSNGSGNGSAT
jgi:hypothetical protein